MSSEARRRERLEELTKFALEKVDWLMSQFEFVLDDTGQFKGELAWTWTGWHTDPSDFLRQEAQKRWGVSDSTARDYARMAFKAMEPKIEARLEEKKKQSPPRS